MAQLRLAGAADSRSLMAGPVTVRLLLATTLAIAGVVAGSSSGELAPKEEFINLILSRQQQGKGAVAGSTDNQAALAALRSQLSKLTASELHRRAVAPGAIGVGSSDPSADDGQWRLWASLAGPYENGWPNLSASSLASAAHILAGMSQAHEWEETLRREWEALRADMQMLLAAAMATASAHVILVCWRSVCPRRRAGHRSWGGALGCVRGGGGGDNGGYSGDSGGKGEGEGEGEGEGILDGHRADWAVDMSDALLVSDDDALAPEPEQLPRGGPYHPFPVIAVDHSAAADHSSQTAGVESPSEDEDAPPDDGNAVGRPLLTSLLSRRYLSKAEFLAVGKEHTEAHLVLLRQSEDFKRWWQKQKPHRAGDEEPAPAAAAAAAEQGASGAHTACDGGGGGANAAAAMDVAADD